MGLFKHGYSEKDYVKSTAEFKTLVNKVTQLCSEKSNNFNNVSEIAGDILLALNSQKDLPKGTNSQQIEEIDNQIRVNLRNVINCCIQNNRSMAEHLLGQVKTAVTEQRVMLTQATVRKNSKEPEVVMPKDYVTRMAETNAHYETAQTELNNLMKQKKKIEETIKFKAQTGVNVTTDPTCLGMRNQYNVIVRNIALKQKQLEVYSKTIMDLNNAIGATTLSDTIDIAGGLNVSTTEINDIAKNNEKAIQKQDKQNAISDELNSQMDELMNSGSGSMSNEFDSFLEDAQNQAVEDSFSRTSTKRQQPADDFELMMRKMAQDN